MNLRIPRSGWILFALVPAACGGGSPGPQGSGGFSSGAAAPSLLDPGASGSSSSGAGASSGAPLEGAGSSGAPAGSSGAPAGSGSGTPAGSGTATPAGSGSTGSPAGSGSVPKPSTGTTTDAFTGAPSYTSKVGNSAHHPGESCSQSNCHGPAGGETTFLVGGTVYKDYKGTTPAPGVEVRVVDAAGKAVSTYSGTNGNFYLSQGGNAVTFPVIVGVRDGTTTRPMVTKITSTAMGSCASSGCHIVGGSPASGAYYPIHVP